MSEDRFDALRRNCPIMRSLKVLGDQWSLLILREMFFEEPQRFATLQSVLGVSPNTLSARLKSLEAAEVIESRMYSEHPPRAEYVLTGKGRALGPVLSALKAWGEAQTPDMGD